MDFTEAFGATFREVGESRRDGKMTRIIRASRTYPTSQQDLWSALTEKERICRWFAEVTGDLEAGGRYAIKDNAAGKITTCEPPRNLALTWEFSNNVSWVSVTVEVAKGGARLTLEHEMPTDPRSEVHWAIYGPGATGVGWDLAFVSLDVHLSGDGQSSLDTGVAWAEGAPGKATLRTWAEDWGDAHIKAGAPVATANEMADRTAGFYTGEN